MSGSIRNLEREYSCTVRLLDDTEYTCTIQVSHLSTTVPFSPRSRDCCSTRWQTGWTRGSTVGGGVRTPQPWRGQDPEFKVTSVISNASLSEAFIDAFLIFRCCKDVFVCLCAQRRTRVPSKTTKIIA